MILTGEGLQPIEKKLAREIREAAKTEYARQEYAEKRLAQQKQRVKDATQEADRKVESAREDVMRYLSKRVEKLQEQDPSARSAEGQAVLDYLQEQIQAAKEKMSTSACPEKARRHVRARKLDSPEGHLQKAADLTAQRLESELAGRIFTEAWQDAKNEKDERRAAQKRGTLKHLSRCIENATEARVHEADERREFQALKRVVKQRAWRKVEAIARATAEAATEKQLKHLRTARRVLREHPEISSGTDWAEHVEGHAAIKRAVQRLAKKRLDSPHLPDHYRGFGGGFQRLVRDLWSGSLEA